MWQQYAKNLVLLFFIACILSTGPAVTFISRGTIKRGLVILFIAVFLGISSEFAQYHYWHRRGIDATPVGFLMAWLFFIVGIVWLWWENFYFWIPIIVVATPILWGYLTGKNKKSPQEHRRGVP